MLKRILKSDNPHLASSFINNLKEGRLKAFREFSPETRAEIALFLNHESRNKILPSLSNREIAEMLSFNDIDDTIEILEFIEPKKQREILKKLKKEKRKKLRKILTFWHRGAGSILDQNFIIVRINFSIKDVADKVEKHIKLDGRVPLVLVTSGQGRIAGYIPYRKLILSKPGNRISKLIRPLPLINNDTGREEIIKKISEIKSEIIAVIDKEGKPLGIIHLHELLKVIQKESTRDVYKLAGVNAEENMSDSIVLKVKRRYKWLIINLATAFLASAVIALFEETIAKIAILAVFMPMVAGEGGNAATQAITVVVRGLALKEVSPKEAKSIIYRESMAGLLNGVIVGIVSTFAAFLFDGPPIIGLILGLAMIINLFVAGLFGATIPFVLKKLRIDPAVASSVFVTTATDVFGFLAFLGLGTIFMM